MAPYLVPDRSCGACTACCVVLTIDDPALRKPARIRCGHLMAQGACGIYESRPHTCRAFHCGWRQLRWLEDAMRPDESGVLIRVHTASVGLQTGLCLGISFLILDRSALTSLTFARAVAASIALGVPVYLDVADASGQSAAQVRVDEALRTAVWSRDNAAILAMLRSVQDGAEADPPAPATSGLAAGSDAPLDQPAPAASGHLGHGPDVC